MPTWITEQVAIGGAAITPDNWCELVEKHRFTAVVNLRAECQDVFGPPLPAAYLWLPVQDHTDPTPEQMLLGAQFVNAAVRVEQRVFIHCRMGIGRSPTLAAAYLITTGLSVDEALRRIESNTIALYGSVVSRLTLNQFAGLLQRKISTA